MAPGLVLLAVALSAGAPAAVDEPPPIVPLVAGRGAAVGTPPAFSLAPLVQRVRPAVVGVTTRQKLGRIRSFLDGLFGDGPFGFFSRAAVGVGSGVVVDSSGLVLTNNHVIDGADRVVVRTADEREYEAEVVGSDPETDVALLRLDGVEAPLPAAQFGSSASLRVGDFVVAIGNPFGLELSVTYGIVSAKQRDLDEGPFDSYLQTDAAINPGNSGGPLFNLEGQVVGINTAIVDEAEGIGFAVPSDLILSLLPQLERNGRVQRGFLGASVQDLSDEQLGLLAGAVERGAFVASVEDGGPAAAAGLQPGDVIVGLDGQEIDGAAGLTRSVALLEPGLKVEVVFVRGLATLQTAVVLGERPGRGD